MTSPDGSKPSGLRAPPPPRPDSKADAEARADYVLKRLEQFIRDGKTFGEGMRFRQWQDMAKVEIVNALLEAEYRHFDRDKVTKRYLFVIGAAMVTLGFWGTAFAYGKVTHQAIAVVVSIVGVVVMLLAVEWRTKRYIADQTRRKRAEKLARIENLTKRIKQLEKYLEGEVERLEGEAEEIRDRVKPPKWSADRENLARQMQDMRDKLSRVAR
ncbi:MAG: hypothetical protein ACPGNT_06590 [Rhodospirillales bacterium]